MPWLSRKNYNFYYLITGKPEKTPLLYLHGYMGSTKRHWYNFIFDKQISTEFYNIFMDIRGFGKNEPLSIVSVKDILLDIDFMLAALKIRKPLWIIGYSLGAYLGLEYTRWKPKNVAGLFLISPVFLSPSLIKTRRHLDVLVDKQKELFDQQKRKNNLSQRIIKKMISNLWGIVKWYSRQKWYIYLDNIYKRDKKILFRFKNIKKPIYIIFAENDSVVGRKILEYLKTYVPWKKIHILKNQDHGIPHENPEILKHLILTTIK